MWIKSQEVEQRYRPTDPTSGKTCKMLPATVDMTATFNGSQLVVEAVSPYARKKETVEVQPSQKNKTIPIKDLLFRFGDTPFQEGAWLGPVEIEGFLPFSALKKLRRQLLGDLEQEVESGRKAFISQVVDQALPKKNPATSQTVEPSYIVRIDRLDLLEAFVQWDQAPRYDLDFVMRPTISTPDWNRCLTLLASHKGNLRMVLPMVLRHWDTRVIRARLAKMKDTAPTKNWAASNPGHFSLLRGVLGANIHIHADFSLYHINTWAVEALEKMGVDGKFTLSLEDDRPNMQALLETVDPSRFEVIAYTDTPLFIAEACSLAALYGGCPGAKVCGHETLEIENEHGDRFQVRHDRCRSTVIGDQALSWSGSLQWFQNLGVRAFRADFTVRDYSLDQIRQIMDALEKDREIGHTHSENLDRILL